MTALGNKQRADSVHPELSDSVPSAFVGLSDTGDVGSVPLDDPGNFPLLTSHWQFPGQAGLYTPPIDRKNDGFSILGMCGITSKLMPDTWPCNLHPDDVGGPIESSSSATSNSSLVSAQPQPPFSVAPMTEQEFKASRDFVHAELYDSDDSLSASHGTNHDAGAEITPRPTPGAQNRSPPQTPLQIQTTEPPLTTPSHSLSPAASASSLHDPLQQMNQLHLRSFHSSPVLNAPWVSGNDGVSSAPSVFGAMGSWQSMLGLQPGTPSPFTVMRAQDPVLGMPMGSQGFQMFIDPAQTRSRPLSMDSAAPAGTAAPSALTTTPPHRSPPLPHHHQHQQAQPARQLASPVRRRSGAPRAPRKTQSTPLFQVKPSGDVPPVPVPPSPNKVRNTPKTIRKLASSKRMSASYQSAEPAKVPGRLRMRGSMAALREASALQANVKGSSMQRRPMTLSFVNYGIEDAEELCSAVAPSGSYKVPLRGYKGESDDDEQQAPNASPQASSPAEPQTPHYRDGQLMSPLSLQPSLPPAPSLGRPMPTELKRSRTTAVLRDFA